MPREEFRVQTTLPFYAAGHLAFVSFFLAGIAMTGPLLVNLAGTAMSLFFAASSVVQSRRPVLISDAGIRSRTLTWHRYDTVVPWWQVESARLGKLGLVPAILFTLRDPGAVAAPGTMLHRQFLRVHARTGAHVAIVTAGWLNRTSRAEIEGAISLYSGGRVLVEHTPFDQLR
ncbi:hypothetical protein [Catenuloplanes indicus]|uniref:PH domain-containing protein n=1 Tax=Catenuloplanes indicus TaxID=137267 RepID=A0AAE3W4S1_9ACTN|nr:hypothetical protein [Catenuloplanes indicus]MDQ0369576.1 hypothetical protein [Catenuloplanes indicus]